MSLNNEFKVKNNLNTLGQILSAGTDLATIFSPIALQTYVQTNSANWNSGGTTSTVVQANSGNWNTAYNVATAYRSVSGSFATNTTVNTLTGTVLPSTYAKLSAQPFTLVTATSSIQPTKGFNTASGNYSTVVGGLSNTASGNYSTVVAGFSSSAIGNYSNVGGGCNNTASGFYSNVNGGACNTASGGYSNVAGGCGNTVSGNYSNVAGGCGNTASGNYSNVGGGCGNTVSGNYSSILGGRCNDTKGFNSTFILGTNLSASQANFTYVSNLSSQGIVTAGGGNSNQWNNVYTLVSTTTATTFNVKGLSATGNTTLNGTLTVGGHVAVEGVTSTGATGTGKFIFDNSPTITGHPTIEGVTSSGATGTGNLVFASSPSIGSPTVTGHPTIEGVTSTGATGSGNLVFASSPSIGSPTVTGHPTVEGITSTGATGTGKFVFDNAPTITGHPTIEGVTSTGATGSGNLVFASSPSIGSPTVTGHPTIEGVTSTGATGTGNLVFASSPSLTNPNLNYFTGLSGAVSGNFSIGGNLYLGGSATYVTQNTLVISDPIIYLNEAALLNTNDIGIAANYVATGGYAHTGLLRDHTSSPGGNTAGPYNWFLFSNMVNEPSANNVAGNSKTIDTLVANVSGNLYGVANTAGALSASRNFSLTSGNDVTAPAIAFNGSGDVALVATIGNNKVTYGKIQTVAANSILGNPTGSSTNVVEIPTSSTGLALLSTTSAAAGATTLGLGTGNSVTFADATVSNGTTNALTKTYYNSTATATLRVNTFATASYNCAKFVVYINNTTMSRKAAFEILAVSDPNSSSNWTGTVYGIIDPSGMLTATGASIGDFDYTGSTLNINITLSAASNFSATVLAQAINA